jgi:predicted RNA-binding Zn-ribbon protein involved in translation (DUF1610 family)
MSMVKRGIAGRGAITFSQNSKDLSKCSKCGKYISIKSVNSNNNCCPYCGNLIKSGE